jgi:putative endonuclease
MLSFRRKPESREAPLDKHPAVYILASQSMECAINREKQIKEWKRKWKMEVIEATNRNWEYLYYALV